MLGSFVVVAVFFFTSVTMAANQAPSQIKLGTLYASSGQFASVSMPLYKGLKLWVKQMNAQGGAYVKPYDKKIPIKLVSYNDGSSTSTAATLYTRLIKKDHVDILASDSASVLTSVAVPIAKENKMLLFNQTGTSNNFFSSDNPYIVQLDVPVGGLFANSFAKFLRDVGVKHGVRRVAMLYLTNDYGIRMSNAVKKILNESGKLEVVYDHGVPTDTSSYTVLLHRIKAANPDMVIQMGYPSNGIAFLRDLQSSGISFPGAFIIYGGIEEEVMKKNVGAEGLQGVFTLVTPADLDLKPDSGMNMKELKKAYGKEYGKKADFSFNSVAGYNTGVIIQKVLANTKSLDQLDLRKAAYALSGKLSTLLGDFKLNKIGEQIGMHWATGQFQPSGNGNKLVPLYPKAIAQGKPVWHSAE
jgi:branched-chain amino acid transport system substrate-binding protein